MMYLSDPFEPEEATAIQNAVAIVRRRLYHEGRGDIGDGYPVSQMEIEQLQETDPASYHVALTLIAIKAWGEMKGEK